MLQDVTQAVENAIQRLLTAPSSTDPHTTPRRVFTVIDNTLKAPSGSGSSANNNFLVPIKDEPDPKGKRVKLESPEPPETTPNTSWTIPHTQQHLDTNPEQLFIGPTPVDPPSTSQAATSNPLSKESIKHLQGTVPYSWPSPSQIKIPAPEKYNGKKGPAAKSFIQDCNTYFLSNAASFPSDHTAQIAEQRLHKLKQLKSASDYATELRIIASKLEWLHPAPIASFRQGLKAEVRSKLIEYTLHKNITALDRFISTACLIDDTLFEARKELRKDSNSSTSSLQRPAQGCSSNFVSKLPTPVTGINGKQVRNPIRFKAWLVFSSQNRQCSAIFYALPLGNRNLILGTPWLKLDNPGIDWTTMKVPLCLDTEVQTGSINAEPQNLPVEFQKFHKVFSEEFFTTLPKHCPYDIAIDLEEDKQPPYGPIYSMSPAESEALKEHMDSELAAGKIVLTTSPVGDPVMFVKRADGRLCLVQDYCWLNAITIKDRYALPRQDKLIEKLCHARIFTKLDLRNGYHNIRIKEGDEWKAAFCTALGHFAPTVMQFGLSNAPAVFMRFMNNIFCDLLDISVVVYLDDILIFSNSREEHVEHHNLFCNPAKCYFFVTEVTYIGLVITPDGISMEKDKVQAIMDWPEPHNKEQPWIWLEEQKAAFDAIKAEIYKEPVLAHPDESKPYTLETDTSGAAMGAVLSQRKEDGCLHPAFMSVSFSPAELNYDMHDKELLAIICAFEHWSIFLEGTEQPITVFTDHKNLEYWKSARTFNRRHAHWHLMLGSYNFVIAYTPGKQLQKPDALSRQPDHMDLEPAPQVMIPESYFEAFSAHMGSSLLDQIKEATQEDPSLDTILLAVSDPKSMPHSIAQKFKDYTIQKGLLLYQGRIVVPDESEIKQQLLSFP
ncbi:Retrotransposable element Tf2 protein [Rhizoctonia solani]|uniref:Retrotransposable element Tf2 protein n=1 Tax=Rhizoctonia solani TaxID=456999 RepID=A0A8H8SST8_9AGAM|nr:Retrotransposable element Tf2 protein [Rhizoctonia solani]QRW16914.1 Retrotransposable element Tf2 protein [Rhizoctonia solani]